MFKLIHVPVAPSGRKLRLILGEKKAAFESVVEWPWVRPTQNPCGTIPCLELKDGTKLQDAMAIAEYLEETMGSSPLLPTDPIDRAGVRSLSNYFDIFFDRNVSSVIVEEKVLKRFSPAPNREPNLAHLRDASAHLKDGLHMIASLAEQNGFLCGALSFADMSAAAHLSTLDYFGDVPWELFPGAREWYARMKSRPSFRTILSDTLPGFPAAKHYANLDF